MNERLEELSDQVRRGIPIDLRDALEVVAYQESLREQRKGWWFTKACKKIKEIWGIRRERLSV